MFPQITLNADSDLPFNKILRSSITVKTSKNKTHVHSSYCLLSIAKKTYPSVSVGNSLCPPYLSFVRCEACPNSLTLSCMKTSEHQAKVDGTHYLFQDVVFKLVAAVSDGVLAMTTPSYPPSGYTPPAGRAIDGSTAQWCTAIVNNGRARLSSVRKKPASYSFVLKNTIVQGSADITAK